VALIVAFVLALSAAWQGETTSALSGITGRWRATVQRPGASMALTLDIEALRDTIAARLSVPEERVLGLRLENLVHAPPQLSFRIPHPDHPMAFAGRVEGDVIGGALRVGREEVPLTFRRQGAVPPPNAREVEVQIRGAERTIAGAMLLPLATGPHPAMALFHATSTANRDHLRYYADLAVNAGIAVLIYDRRDVPLDLAELRRADFLDVVADAEAAVRFLCAHAEVDRERVGVGGLSQGAWISAIVAARVPEVAFVLALSCPGVPLHEVDLYQTTRRLQQARVDAPSLAEAQQLLADLHAAARGEGPERATLDERLSRARERPWASIVGLPEGVPSREAAPELLRWSAMDLDPRLFFERIRAPVLLAYGSSDERLPAERCAERLGEALARSGNERVTQLVFPQANHALLPAPDLDRKLTEWLRAQVGVTTR
jgi:hypothetical protein